MTAVKDDWMSPYVNPKIAMGIQMEKERDRARADDIIKEYKFKILKNRTPVSESVVEEDFYIDSFVPEFDDFDLNNEIDDFGVF